ncbi:hypothetical protein DO97_02665 [Neosynechococcus sphagnicola sy1]|uniref:Uncharacterized protein n=1 Tax=Neosynechococcus sphagnicola sy1 TaxID=1497020 RepID=A0A098TL18_9CYAN|nr:hypothetical protein [Neosynechococcus sphagnicola]KGF72984.1 hypothetical protein DO97_02665 [Neosynechococcus sphagnicola sy1]
MAPYFNLISPGDRLSPWLFTSVPLGIGGAVLIGASSYFISDTSSRLQGTQKTLMVWLGQAGGGLGLVGVMFPLLMIALEFILQTVKHLLESSG